MEKKWPDSRSMPWGVHGGGEGAQKFNSENPPTCTYTHTHSPTPNRPPSLWSHEVHSDNEDGG